MVYRLLFFDHFDNAAIGLSTSFGNGAISEPAGTSLVLSGLAGADCDWAASPLHYAPVGYKDLGSFVREDRGLVYFEARLTSFTETLPNNAYAGLALWKDRDNFYKAGFTWSGSTAFLAEYVGGVSTVQATGNAMGDPGAVAHRYRFYWNPSKRTGATDLDGRSLTQGQAAFYYSSNDGATWTFLSPGTMGFLPTLFGVLAGNYHGGTRPGFSASWDYLGLWQDDQENFQNSGASGLEDSGHAGEQQSDTARLLPFGDRPAEGFEDTYLVRLGLVPAYRPSSNDPEGHAFFIDTLGSPRLRSSFVYDATNDPWNSPMAYQLDGYGRDGYFYIAGAKQISRAPWALEPAGPDRSSRSDFPVRSLIVTSQSELSIFDLDSWPASLKLWMRFRLGNASNFYLLGRIADSLRMAKMANGVLVASSVNNGTDNGALFCVDFKRTDTSFAFMVQSTGWSNGSPGRNISNRNQTGEWTGQGTGFVLDSTYVHSVQVTSDPTNKERLWIMAGSDNEIQIVETLANQPQFVHSPVGALIGPRGDLTSGRKCATFDSAGWLWLGWGPYVFRAISDFRGGVVVMGLNAGSPEQRHRYVQLLHPTKSVVIRAMTQVGDSVYVATNVGVYRINRFSMDWYLCYTTTGGLGGGRFNRPPAGELLRGVSPAVDWIEGFVVDLGQKIGYLAMASSQATFSTTAPLHGGGAVTVVRTFDDVVVDHRTYTGSSPGLAEDGAWFLTSLGT